MITRRSLAGFAGAAVVLSACAGKTQSQLQQDTQLIAAGAQALLAAVANLPNVPADVVARVQAVVTQIQNDSASIATTLTPSADIVKSIASGVQMLVPLLSPFFPVAPAIAAVLQAALALVPVIMSAAGVAGAAPKATMSPDAARATLKMVAK